MESTQFDGAARRALLAEALALVEEHYVDVELARSIVAQMRSRMERGDYDDVADAAVFCQTVTEHLQAAGGDRHLRFRSRGSSPMTPVNLDEYRRSMALQNWGFRKVERLAGNVGYLDLRGFHIPEFAGDTAAVAMSMLANSSALIIDLRECPGGSPQMVQLLSSYLFGGEPVHLNSIVYREDGKLHTQQSWTHAWVPGRRLGPDVPVYVLTSGFTFSAAEEFTYNLKHLKRATVVGETTRGGAMPGRPFPLGDQFEIFISFGRSVSPYSGGNWEGTGVEPDIAAPKAEALVVAYREALTGILANPDLQSLAAEAEKALVEGACP